MQVPAAVEEFFICVDVPDPLQDFKVHFDGTGDNDKPSTLLKRKYTVLFHHSEADRQHQNPAKFLGGVESPISGSGFPTPVNTVPAHQVDGTDPNAKNIVCMYVCVCVYDVYALLVLPNHLGILIFLRSLSN